MAKEDTWQTGSYSSGYSHVYRKRRAKTDWAGVGIGEAFKSNLDYYLRVPAQRAFYQMVKKAQMTVAELTGSSPDAEFEARVKPQLGPCYTTYPSTLAAYAGIGLTAFLEFKARVGEKILLMHLGHYLRNPAKYDRAKADPKAYKRVVEIVIDCVQTRLLLEDLSRLPAMSAVELYRLFSASQESLTFNFLPGIIRSVILYGDVLPDWRLLDLHPLTRSLLRELTDVCNSFFEQLQTVKGSQLPQLGMDWVRAVCVRLDKYLPSPEDKPVMGGDTLEELEEEIEEMFQQLGQKKGEQKFRKDSPEEANTDRIAPLDGPNPPALFEPTDTAKDLANKMVNNATDREDVKAVLDDFAITLEEAGGQDREWEDMRSDLVERVLGISAFHESPIEGNPAEGHEVNVKLQGDLVAGGEIFDRPVELSDDLAAHERLLAKSQPITEALRRSLYPNIQEVLETQRLRASGSLDPARLALADFSSVIFKRYRMREMSDRRGRPVLVIACDGSGSLNSHQMKMVKILAAGWLNSTAKSDVQVLAGLYHSGQIREGVSGPLVQWIYHPHKTPATSRRDASRSLVSLPNTGTGVQSDALSLAFIMGEARGLARNNMVYLILISDTEWNRSFQTGKDGKEEVYSYFKTAYEEFSGKLHTTLVALGVSGETGFEDMLDKVIAVSDDELGDYVAVAEKIGVYVASCMRERRKVVGDR